MKIGFDIGDTLLDTQGRIFSACSREERLGSFRPFPHSLDAIKELASRLNREDLFIISKCPIEEEEKLLEWLQVHGFVGEKTVFQSHVYFCRERKDKGPIIKKLNLDAFIDNRIEIFEHTRDFNLKRLLFNAREMRNEHGLFLTVFDDWSRLVDLLEIS